MDSKPKSRIVAEMMRLQQAVKALDRLLRRLVPLLTAAAQNGTEPEKPSRPAASPRRPAPPWFCRAGTWAT